jgi:mono/diheme cytochrome c family protein
MPSIRANTLIVAASIFLSAAIVIVSASLAKPKTASPQKSDGLAAWQQVYSVLISPRCINCHTASNYPEQGDNRARHFANVVRGPGGTGVAGFRCVTCHQKENADSTGVPGGQNWHLAPLSMKWQDLNDEPLSSTDICRAITDRARNGGLNGAALLKHHTEEPLVLWAWSPGRRVDGSMRTLPPLTHDEFVAATKQWVEAGMPCPK